MNITKETGWEKAERWTVGRLVNIPRIPLQVLTIAGIIAKIAIKAIFCAPIEGAVNLVRWGIHARNQRQIEDNDRRCGYEPSPGKAFEYLSPSGSDYWGFKNDLSNIQFVARDIKIAVERFILAPIKEDYFDPKRMNFRESTNQYAYMVFTNNTKERNKDWGY